MAIYETNIVQSDLGHVDTGGCSCPACTGDVGSGGTDEASLDPAAGGTFNNKPVWTVQQIAAHLNRTGGGFADGFRDTATVGRQNNIGDDNSVITFGFFDTLEQVYNNGYTYTANNAAGVPTLYGLSEAFNFAAFSEAQRGATREVMQSWDDVAAVTFKEASADDADMNFGNLASAPTTQAYARIPTASLDALVGGQVREIGGDSWISASQASNFQLDEGGYGLQTLLHEAGHSLGLSHPGAYNAAPGLSITYTVNAEYAQDTRAYSVMSYFNGSVIAGTRHFDFNLSTTVYSGVPLIHDIAAIQAIYGADMTTRTGDTVYGFNSNAGRDSYDFVKTPAPVMAIWDAGGNDTIDASGYATEQLIDLNPGSLSSIGGVTFENAPSFDQVNANRAAAGFAPVARATYDTNMAALKANPVVGRLTDNVGIAYGATIENAIGGSGNDVLIGNAVANQLTGNAGVDVASYRGASAGVQAALDGRGGGSGTGGDAAGDRYFSIEGLEGSAFDDRLTGSTTGDILRGLAGADQLDGGGGDDQLDGGAGDDGLTGGMGRDTLLGGAGVDRLDGGNDADQLDGGDDADTLLAGNGADTLLGGAGDDRLEGGNDVDTLNGGDGADTLLGGNGDDVLTGGAGFDRLEGGNGRDRFVATLGAKGTVSVDLVTDYSRGSDTIDLSGIDANTLVEGDQAFTFVTGSELAAGQVALRSFASIGEAEAALGFDLDGVDGPSTYRGAISVLVGDVDGGGVDFATVLVGARAVPLTDVLL